MLQTQTVKAETLALIKRLMADPRLTDFILVGGTALALTMGHRESIDIDLFIDCVFDAEAIAEVLRKDYSAEFIKTNTGTVTCFIEGVKADLMSHPYPVLENHETIEGIRIMSAADIAALKLHAIVNDGTRVKDFTDVHFLLEEIPLARMFGAYEIKYYPNTSRDVARLALRDHSRIDFKVPILLTDSTFNWSEIDSRLLDAIENPFRIYERQNQRTSLTQKQEIPRQKRGRRI